MATVHEFFNLTNTPIEDKASGTQLIHELINDGIYGVGFPDLAAENSLFVSTSAPPLIHWNEGRITASA